MMVQSGRVFSSCSLFQSEAKYEAIDMKLFFILMQMTLIITRKVLHEASFKSKGFENSEKAY